MKLFLKFLWMGISNVLSWIFAVALLFIPIVIGLILGSILVKKIPIFLAIICSAFIILAGYWLLYTIVHAYDACKYYKEHDTNSLEVVWKETSWFK